MRKFSHQTLPWAGIILTLVSLSACKATQLSEIKKDSTYDASGMKRVFVIALMKTERGQKMLEDEFVRHLEKNGRQAVASYTSIPHEKKLDEEAWKAVINANRCDSVIVSRLVEMKIAEKEVGAKLIAVGNAGSGYDYYGTAYGSVYQGASYNRDQTAFLETKVFDVASGKEVWSAQSKTKIAWGGDPVPQVRTFVNLLAKEAKR